MLTATKQSKTGYWAVPLKKNLYSLEEINYFLYNHIDLVYRDFFSEELFTFIDEELEQPFIAQDLRDIAANNGSTADFVKYILNESFYYSKAQLSDISALVAGIDTMTQAERLKIQGDAAYRAGYYNSALKCYLEILRNADSGEDKDSFYASVAYAVGIIYASMFMCKSANSFFTLAYDFYPDPMYARACVYMSIISEDDEELLSSIVRFKITDDVLDSIKNRARSLQHELETGYEMQEFSQSLKSPDFADELVKSWKERYYSMQK